MITIASTIKAVATVKGLNHNKRCAQYAVWQAVGQTYAIARGIPDAWFIDTEVFSFRDSSGKHIHWSVVGQNVINCIARGEDFAAVYNIGRPEKI